MSLERTIKTVDNLTVITLKGDLEVSVADEFIEFVRDLCEDGARHFLLDLTRIDSVDSSGLGSLIRILTIIRKLDGTMHLLQPGDKAYRVFKITRLDGFFHFVESEQQVLTLLGEQSEPGIN